MGLQIELGIDLGLRLKMGLRLVRFTGGEDANTGIWTELWPSLQLEQGYGWNSAWGRGLVRDWHWCLNTAGAGVKAVTWAGLELVPERVLGLTLKMMLCLGLRCWGCYYQMLIINICRNRLNRDLGVTIKLQHMWTRVWAQKLVACCVVKMKSNARVTARQTELGWGSSLRSEGGAWRLSSKDYCRQCTDMGKLPADTFANES